MLLSLGLLLERRELLKLPDLRLDRRVAALLAGDVVVHARQPAGLHHVEPEDEHDHGRPAADHHVCQTLTRLTLADLGGEKVDLAHGRLPGIARPTATGSTGSACAIAS